MKTLYLSNHFLGIYCRNSVNNGLNSHKSARFFVIHDLIFSLKTCAQYSKNIMKKNCQEKDKNCFLINYCYCFLFRLEFASILLVMEASIVLQNNCFPPTNDSRNTKAKLFNMLKCFPKNAIFMCLQEQCSQNPRIREIRKPRNLGPRIRVRESESENSRTRTQELSESRNPRIRENQKPGNLGIRESENPRNLGIREFSDPGNLGISESEKEILGLSDFGSENPRIREKFH